MPIQKVTTSKNAKNGPGTHQAIGTTGNLKTISIHTTSAMDAGTPIWDAKNMMGGNGMVKHLHLARRK